jgi:UDPglucose 6-dehydrogenase
MRIAMLGTGYVGLVTGACFADSGNQVTCVDIDEEKIAGLKKGVIPIYEPGLSEMVLRNAKADRLRFTTNLEEAVRPANVVYIAVGTPQADDGSANMSHLNKAVDSLAPYLSEKAIVVIKSTVPVGTNTRTYARLNEITGRDVDVASNPEFLKEGAAIDDFTLPDRVVVGVRRQEVADVLNELYAPFLRTDHPFLVMSPESAELTKYVANAMLATKISFINEMANICERTKGDINQVRRGIGHDKRIGFAFLHPSNGYGGSCFPKDIRALAHMAKMAGVDPLILHAIDRVNDRQKQVLIAKIDDHFQGNIAGKRFAVWGLSFKPKTDDIREAPSLVLIDWLLKGHAQVAVFDPEAMNNVRKLYGDKLTYGEQSMAVLDKADALVINTEWSEFRNPNFDEMRSRMAAALIFDGRNLYDPETMAELGFTYYSIGRMTARPGGG